MPVYNSRFKVACHTDNVGPETTFVAIKGTKYDGTTFIKKAYEQGCRTIICEAISELPALEGITYKIVENSRLALAQESARAYNYPAKKLKIIGITGTKGKTSTTYLIEHLLQSLGHKTARLSTVANAIGNKEERARLTTAQPDYLHAFFNECVLNNVEYVIMEVAAQAATLHRVEGIAWHRLLFMNFEAEHGEFYQSIQDYFDAKVSLTTQYDPINGCVLYTADDIRIKNAVEAIIPIQHRHSLSARAIDTDTVAGIRFTLNGEVYTVPQLSGYHNVLNTFWAITCIKSLGLFDYKKIYTALISFVGIPGRLQKISPSNTTFDVYVDYAHTPTSVAAILQTVRPLTKKLIVVTGAGGDRDSSKRPIIGNYCSSIADHTIFTDDNPRTEDPKTIMSDIMSGVSADNIDKTTIIHNREEAIQFACRLASPGSIVLLLGKGPDEYQEVQGTRHPFSEKTIVTRLCM